jgi:GTPase SAR1 family protein
METSAKTGENVDQLFLEIAENVYELVNRPKISQEVNVNEDDD